MRRTPGGPTGIWGASGDRTTSPGTRFAWTAGSITLGIRAPCGARYARRRRKARPCGSTGNGSGPARREPLAARICARSAGSPTRLREGCRGCARPAHRRETKPGILRTTTKPRMRTANGGMRCGQEQRRRQQRCARSAARPAGRTLCRMPGTGCTARTSALRRRRWPGATRRRRDSTGWKAGLSSGSRKRKTGGGAWRLG